jgi:DNA-binding transcriptional LysR family regulator
MVAVRLTPPFPLVVVGSPDYLRRRDKPKRIDDLRDHACLRMRRSSGAIAPWTFVDGNKSVEVIVSGPLIAYDFPTMLGAALEGLGLAQVPQPGTIAAIKAGKLVAVLEPYAPATPGMFLYYPGHRQILPKLRAFIDHVRSSAAAEKARGKRR